MNKYTKHIYKKIKEYDTIVIVRHQNSDMDALGSQFGLKSWITSNFKNKKVYCIGENHNKYTKNFIPKSDEFTPSGKFLGICVDVNSIDRIDGGETFIKADYKICIDHHHYKENNEFDFVYINDKIIACAQIIAQMLFDIKKPMNTDTCKYLFAGIHTDSGGFFYPLTDYVTFKVASELIKRGNFSVYNDVHYLISMDSYDELKVTNKLFNKIIASDTGFAYYENSIEDLKELGVTASGANTQIGNFNRIEEFKIFLSASECEDHTYRCSIRSKNISVVEVAKKYGGGGHNFACGCKGLTKEDLENLKLDLNNLTK